MDMKRITSALEAYKARLEEKDYRRLELFEGIWEIQNRHSALAAEKSAYPLPSTEVAEHWYWQEKPFLLMAPVSIDSDTFVAALEDISCYLVDNAGLEKKTTECMQFFDWRGLVDSTDVSLAGHDPQAYADTFCALAEEHSESALQPEIALVVLRLALRPMLEHAPSALMASLESVLRKGNLAHNKPLHCPGCGSKATAAFIGETPSIQGNGRLLYCGTCGNVWEFERIRCPQCGTRNQGHLHYFHIEGDEAHKLQICDECGEYTRTVFQESLNAPFVFEVEDLVMTPLDMVANDPRFTLKKDTEE